MEYSIETTDLDMRDLGLLLRKLREECLKVGRAELGRNIDYAPAILKKFEDGNGVMSIAFFNKLIKVYGLKVLFKISK